MSELVALVDSSGAARTPGLPRDEAFERAQSDPELYIPIAVAVIFNGIGWVLVQKRAGGKVDAGKLDLVCGIVPAGEDPADTAVRESIEETNVEPFGVRGIHQGVITPENYRHLFVGYSDRSGRTVTEPNAEVEWVRFMHHVAATALAGIKGQKAVFGFKEHLGLAIKEERESSQTAGLVERSSFGHMTVL